MADEEEKPGIQHGTWFRHLSDSLNSDWAKFSSIMPASTIILRIPHHGLLSEPYKIPKFDLGDNAAKWAELEKSLSKIIAISDNDAVTIFNYSRIVSKLVEATPQKVDFSVSSVIIPERKVTEGVLVKATSLVWTTVLEELEKKNWENVHEIPPRIWEEIIAGAFVKAGFDEVILTPRSADHGRDVIAVRKGVGSIKILDSVKAYKPGHLVTKEEVHALMGVVAVDPNASKGILTTTSDFAPRLLDDPRLAQTVPPSNRTDEWGKAPAMA